MPGSSKLTPSFKFPRQKPVRTFPLPDKRYMPCPSYYFLFHHPKIIIIIIIIIINYVYIYLVLLSLYLLL
jgi:hypothetical protein